MGPQRDVREDFPVLRRPVHGRRLVYLDNAATTQKPQTVLDTLDDYYRRYNANVHRSVHKLAEEATLAYEAAREQAARFFNAARTEEIIFTSGTTEGINLVAYTWGRANIGPGDAIVLTEMEHHSNLVPWQILAQEKGAELRFLEIGPDGSYDLDAFDRLLDERVKLVAFAHLSNVMGLVLPAAEIARRAHSVGAKVLIDAAQSAARLPIDVKALGCDFLVMSGHKIYGPTGIGVLWGRYDLLADMPPFLGGGEMIRRVELYSSTFQAPPARFEAGTPKIAQAIGLAEALKYVDSIGLDWIDRHERDLARYAHEELSEIEGITIFGPPAGERTGLVTFTVDGVHPHDLASLVDTQGVAIRAGHHCCMPLHDKLGVPATARASFALYNTNEDVDALVEAIHHAKKVFA